MAYALRQLGYEVDLDDKQLNKINSFFKPVKAKALESGLLNPVVLGTDTDALNYQIPGGMLSNLVAQLTAQHKLDKLEDVLKEVPRVRKDLGYPPLVTPMSQMVGVQATANVLTGEYKNISKEIKSYVKGEYGKADVMAKSTYVNGEETERTILSSVTLKEPVTEYRLRGTKVRPTWMPTGSFRWPTSGRISSYFGGRKSPGGIGSTNHKGIDIAGSRGQSIKAADGGTVSYAGWMNGYGYLVIIDHGNGYQTYYGHNSSLVVSTGEHVYKGQQIARMGSTGVSSGNHCHFGILINGTFVNPLNYL